jgi:Helix-turn-helix domain
VNNGRRFSDEEWLTPMQIARKLGYATDKPVRNAIRRGELKASHAPCRRKIIVAESEVLRWIEEELLYEPVILDPEPPNVSPALNGQTRRRREMPTLDYVSRRGEQQ